MITYDTHWFTKPIFKRKSEPVSPFWWSENKGQYTLSFLGMLNGLMEWTGYICVANIVDETMQVEGFELRKKWW